MSSEIPGYTKITKDYLRENKAKLLEIPLYQKPPALSEPMLYGTITNINDESDGNPMNQEAITIRYLPKPIEHHIIIDHRFPISQTLYLKNSDIGVGGGRRRKTKTKTKKTRKNNKRKTRKSYKKC